MWWIWLVIVGVIVVVAPIVLFDICSGRGSSSTSQRPNAEVTQESAIEAQWVAPKTAGVHAMVWQSEMQFVAQESPMFKQDLGGSDVYLGDCNDDGADAGGVTGLKARFPHVAAGGHQIRAMATLKCGGS
jgi:hypothetical protein